MVDENKFRLVTENEPVPTERCYLIFAPRSARLIANAQDQATHRQ
jgi:hypothetical protein